MKNWKLPILFKTPLGMVFALGLIVMLVELLIMSVIHAPPIAKHLSIVHRTLVDAILLTLIVFPVLYFLIFKRLESEKLLRQINASAQEAIVIVNEKGRITDWNPAAQRYFQYTREEAIGKQPHLLLAPSHYHSDAVRDFADFQKTGKGPLIGSIIEVAAIRKDGSEFPVELSVTALKVKGGWQAVAVMRDISERKRAEDKLRASEAKFSTIFESNPAMIAIGTIEGVIVDANLSYANFLGYTRQEMMGKSLADLGLIDEDELQSLLVLGRHASDSLRNVEVTLRTRDGNPVNVLLSAEYVALDGMPYRLATLQDITERKKLALLLEEKEYRLRTLVNTIPDLIWLKDINGVYQSCNPMFERFFGAREADIVGKSDFDFVDRELAESFREHDRIAMAADKPSVNEEWVVFADDGYRALLETIKTPMRDAGGKLLGVLGIARDITVRKKLEQDREQYLKFFVLSINPMCIADPYGCFTQVNPAFVKLTGYSESELIAKPFLDFVLPEDRQRTEDEMKLQVEKRPTLYFENRYLCKDGSVIDLSWTAYYDKNDGVTYATAIDTTERKRTEESLRKLSQAMEQSPSAIGITDLNANIEYVNESFVKVTGYSRAELIGKNPRLLQSGKTPKASYVDMWAHLLRGEMWKGEFTNRRKDGSEYIESALMSPVRQADGRVTHYLTIKEDITQLKQAQQAVQISRENLHRLLNSMAEGAYGVDTHGDCTFVNLAFLRMLNYPHEDEVLGKHMHELIHHSHADGSPYPENECKAYRAYRENQSINVSDEVFWRKDGVAVPVEYWSHPIVAGGVTTGAIVTFVDITERMNAIAAMREKELLLSESQRIAHIGSWRFESPGNLWWSDETYRIYGVSPETFTLNAESFFNSMVPEDRPLMQEWIAACMAGKKPDVLEFRISKPDGTVRCIRGFGDYQPGDKNNPPYLTGMVYDITEHKLADARLADQLEELRRWHEVTSGRESRILELKHEVNEMLGQAGQPMRYPSAESQDQMKE